MLKPGFNATPNRGRRIARPIALLAVAVSIITLVALSGVSAVAGPYGWDGGHDAVGSSAPSGTAYFAEGTTRNGFEEYLIMRNPGADVANVTIKYLFPSGSPQTQVIDLAPWAGASICVNDVVGPGKDVSVSMDSTPGIIAEREIYFNYKTIWTGGHAARGVEEPRDTWYFAEGTTRAGFQEWLCLQNPASHAINATLTYMLGTGETRDQAVILPANSRQTVDVNTVLGPGQDASIRVAAAEPVIAERPMYFDYKGAWRGGDTATGSADLSGSWDFAEGTTRAGFEEWLCVMNPGPDATAHIQYMFPGGAPVTRDYPLKAHSRTTVSVNEAVGPEKDVSIHVGSDGEVLCERPMYFNFHGAWEGGHDVVGALSGERTWYFPTGCVGPNFLSYLCVENPGDLSNKVLVEVHGDGGDYNSQDLVMEPHSRATFDISALGASVRNPWLKVSGTKDLIAERPVYFSYATKVASVPFTIAKWAGIDIKSPIAYSDCLGPQFHEAAKDGANCPPMQPYGLCMGDYNAGRLAPGLTRSEGNDPAYFVESTRARGTYSTTACDVHAKAGSTVYAPVDGTVVAAEPYLLYGKYPDFRVKIRIDGQPNYLMEVLHMRELLTSVGARVEAGKTKVGVVRDLVPYFYSGPNPFTREEGNHAHIQINYAPGGGTGPQTVSN